MTPIPLFLALALIPIAPDGQARQPRDDADLKRWLVNMVGHHRFSPDEVRAATGLGDAEIADALNRFDIQPGKVSERPDDAPLLVLPYPGGRHPRIGFLEGAVDPQRDTKFSVFTPWDASSYVVVDLPEAIWSNLGLTYLAHTHVPTIWTERGVTLVPTEWTVHPDGPLTNRRELPNGIAFAAKVVPTREAVRLSLTLTNGTDRALTDLRVQNCVMLRGAKGFERQTDDNKVFRPPYVAARSDDGRRWIIVGFEPIHRAWANAPVPCLHADPKFPDCPPGATRQVRGILAFHEGEDLDDALRRLDATGWRDEPDAP